MIHLSIVQERGKLPKKDTRILLSRRCFAIVIDRGYRDLKGSSNFGLAMALINRMQDALTESVGRGFHASGVPHRSIFLRSALKASGLFEEHLIEHRPSA